MPTIGEVIRRYRRLRMLTQKELAEQIDVRYQTVQDWEAGRAKPRPKHLRALVEVLQVPAEQLVEPEDCARAA